MLIKISLIFQDRILQNDLKIIKITNHPNYQPPKKYFDIALMELENEVIFTRFVQPACLWSGFDTSSLGDKATLTGWGVVNAGRWGHLVWFLFATIAVYIDHNVHSYLLNYYVLWLQVAITGLNLWFTPHLIVEFVSLVLSASIGRLQHLFSRYQQ